MSDAADAIAHFARLRAAFHACCEGAEQREATLAALRAADPALAAELATLLQAAFEEAADCAAAVDAVPKIAGFTLSHELGRGASGVVWQALQLQAGFQRVVALKLLHAGRSAVATRRFQREWQVLARLDHPSIARLLDAGVAGAQPWLALEYVDGLPYAEALPRLPLRARVEQLLAVCHAVAHAHARLVLHRDLKPANLRFGSDGRLRLLDFGIARLLDADDAELTLAGMPAGTPRYSAPEQLRGEAVGTAADVYALGRLLQEANTGDRSLGAIAERAAAEAPSARHASAAALAEDLGDWLAGRPPRSGVGSRAMRWRARIRQWRGALLAALAVTLALGLGLATTLQQAAEARREAERAGQHLTALLDVIAAASPTDFAGRDPPASAVLIEASRRLQAMPAADPDLIWKSQTAIGAGLINLGRAAEAAPALEAALAALADATDSPAAGRELDTLRLLAHTADNDADRLARIEARILAAANSPDAPAGEALSALATIAALQSRRGDFVAARRLLAAGEPRLRLPGVSPEQAENYWRQRGWSALRERDLQEAERAFAAAQAVIDASPAAVSALRAAELGWLRVELALQAGDPIRARAELDAIQSVYEATYPATHPERGVYARLQARAAWLAGDLDSAYTWLQHAAAVPESARSAIDQRQQIALEAAVSAGRGDCAAAQARAAGLARPATPDLPHHAAVVAAALAVVERCGSSN